MSNCTTIAKFNQTFIATNQTSLIEKYKGEIETLKNLILLIFINKGVLLLVFTILLFVVYVILKRYIRKKIKQNDSNDVENQNLNNYEENFDIFKEFLEFQKIVSSILNINSA